MDRFVAKLNIEHFRELLAGLLVPEKRDQLERMLKAEEATLADAEKQWATEHHTRA